MAAAKAGFRVVDIDPTITDIPSIREFLRQTEVKALYFFNFDNDTEYGDLLRKSIPELFYCTFCCFFPYCVLYTCQRI